MFDGNEDDSMLDMPSEGLSGQITDDEDIIDVTCGSLSGKLHKPLFICPGIHQECIEVNGQFVTPKMFFVMGGKERLKDWKNAIRIQGVSIRRLMDAGNFEFYNHRATCTGRCVSRNNPKLEKDGTMKGTLDTYPLDVGEQGYGVISNLAGEVTGVIGNSSSNGQLVFPTPTTVSCTLGTLTHPDNCDVTQTLIIKQEPQSDDEELNAIASGMLPQTVIGGKVLPTGTLEMTVANGTGTLANVQPAKRVSNINVQHVSFSGLTGLPEDILTDSQTFWQGILGLGLIDDFFREIKASLDVVKNDLVRHRVRPEDCQKISKIVSELGLMTKLKWKLAAHKTETEKQKQKLHMEMEALKRRMAESEQKQRELKRKSDCFDHLIDMSKAKRQNLAKVETPSSSPSPASSPMPVSATRIVTVTTPSTTTVTVPVTLTRAVPAKEATQTSETTPMQASPVASPNSEGTAD